MYRNIGILGFGIWEGKAIGNEALERVVSAQPRVQEPFKGMRAEDGTVRVAGLELEPGRYRRTITAIERSFQDPYRGTRRRRWFPQQLKVSDAETEAARGAIESAGLTAGDIDAVLIQSYLPDVPQPKNAGIVANNLGIKNALCWEVDSLCNSVISQSNVAAALIQAEQVRHVLCIQSVAYSRTSDPGTSAAVLDGDMATAFVVGARAGATWQYAWRTEGRLHDSFQLRWMVPAQSSPPRYWEGSLERLLVYHDEELQKHVMSNIAQFAQVVCTEALRRADMRLDEIELFITHQPISWFSPFIEETLSLPEGVTVNTFEEYASINSCSLSMSMREAARIGRLKAGTKMLVFGPATGNVYGAIAVRW